MAKFKISKARINSTDVVVAGTAIARMIANISDMAQFIPARAAASAVLVILQIVQEIDNNKVACYKLARRTANILIDLKHRVAGRWDSAPQALIDNIFEYETVLERIRDFMQELKKVKWVGHLLRKGSIEAALGDFHDILNEAEHSFQTASLIEIHYAVGILHERSTARADIRIENRVQNESIDDELSRPVAVVHTNDVPIRAGSDASLITNAKGDTATEVSSQLETITQLERISSEVDLVDEGEELQLQEELKELERLGFKTYHQTDVRLLSEANSAHHETFWRQTATAEVAGQRIVAKLYDNASATEKRDLRRWLHDLKILRILYHPNLPQLAGYSDEKCRIPFILLSQPSARDPRIFILNSLRNLSIADCAILALQMYKDILSAAVYVQCQLSFDERQTQEFIDETSYTIDSQSGKLILGIPAPKGKDYFHGFGYPLTESLLGAVMQILPTSKSLEKDLSPGIVDLQDKLAHVRAFAYNLLPSRDAKPGLRESSVLLLEDAEFQSEKKPFSLSHLRKQNIQAGTHEFAWHTDVHSSPISFNVGDIGYISHGHGRVSLTDKSRFNHFVKVANIFDELVRRGADFIGGENLSIVREVTGTLGQWINGFRDSNEVWPFALPEDVEGWPISVSPGSSVEVHVRHSAQMASVSEAWRILQREAEKQAAIIGIKPYELILITKAISGQIYRVNDWSPSHPALFRQPVPFARGAPPFNHGSSHQQMPRILYLFTSFREDFVPFMAEKPSVYSLRHGQSLPPRNISMSTAWGRPEAFIDYIQLSAEDFISQR